MTTPLSDESASNQVQVLVDAFELDPLIVAYNSGDELGVITSIHCMSAEDAKRLLTFAVAVISITLPAWSREQEDEGD